MKSVLIDLFTSKKFLAALTAIAVYVAGRFGFDLDTAALDRIVAAFLVYIGAQGVADAGKSAAAINAVAANAGTSSEGNAAMKRVAGSVAVLALVVLGLAAASATACTPTQRTTAGHAVVDCTAASAGAIGGTLASMRGDCFKPATETAPAKTDWGCVRGKAISAGLQVGGCAFLELVTTATTARVASATGEPPPERPGVAAFESYRASVAGGAAFRTAAGDR
jgi:hypothetical protein